MTLADWLWIVAGIAAAAAGAAVTGWSLAGDWLVGMRRGRTRRCPRCWYSMEGSAGRRCPECGREARSERRMLRSRRRWLPAAAGAALMLAGAAAVAWPLSAGGAWKKWVPNTALIVMLPWTDEMWPLEELQERLFIYQGYIWWRPRTGLQDWQWRLLRGRMLSIAESDAPSMNRRMALGHLALGDPGPLPVSRVAAIFREWLQDSDAKLRENAAFMLDRLRYELGAEREPSITALNATDGAGARWAEEWIVLARDRLPRVTPEEEVEQERERPPSPDEIVRRLDGASGRDALVVLRDLGSASRRTFLQPYDGEAGPLQVLRFDLNLDGRDGEDAVVRIGDADGVHWTMVILLRDGDRWTFVDTLHTSRDPPLPRVEETANGRRWLVIKAGGPYTSAESGDWHDAWFELAPGVLRGVLDTGNAGFICLRGTSANDRFVNATLDSNLTILDKPDWPGAFEYDLHAVWTLDPARLASTPTATPPPPPIALFEERHRIRFRWDRRKRAFVVDPEHSTWTVDDTYAVIHDTPDEFLASRIDHLLPLARSDDPWVQSWLQELLDACADSPEKARLEQAMQMR